MKGNEDIMEVSLGTEQRVKFLKKFDPEIAELLECESVKQRKTIGLIASENVASPLSMCLEGSIFTNKNTEGYPGKRYVGGTENEDKVELIAIERLKKLFGCEHEERYLKLLENVKDGKVFEAGEVKIWKCRNCGHIVVGTKAPEVCSVCSHPKAYFEIKAENY